MAIALIAEFDEVMEWRENVVPVVPPPIAEQKVDYTTSTQSAALNANTRMVRIAAKDGPLHIKIGSNPTATASSALFLPAGGWEYYEAAAGEKIACYDGSS